MLSSMSATLLRRCLLALLLVASVPVSAQTPTAPPATGQAEKIKVAVRDLKPNGVAEELTNTLTSMLSNELAPLEVFSVITNQEIRAILSHDALRQAVGCEAGEACN